MRLQTKLLALTAALLCLMLLVILKFIQVYEGDFVHEDVSNRAQAISRLVASNSKLQDWMARSPLTPEGLEGIQRYSEQVRLATGVEFIVIFDNHGKRLSHPNPAKIGLHIQGADESGALRGEEYISVSIGTLGESIRAFTPIFHDGRQVGAVVTGITTANAKTLTEARMTKMLGPRVPRRLSRHHHFLEKAQENAPRHGARRDCAAEHHQQHGLKVRARRRARHRCCRAAPGRQRPSAQDPR